MVPAGCQAQPGTRKNLKQEGQIADQLDVAAREPRDEPIGGQPRDADGKAQDRCQHDADPRHQKSIDQADEENASVAVGFAVGNERLVHAKSRGIGEKTESARELLCRKISACVERELVGKPCGQCEQSKLIDQRAKLRIVAQRHAWRGNRGIVCDCSGVVYHADQGGA